MALSGCATKYKTPCTVWVKVDLVDWTETDAICREDVGVKMKDDGTPIKPTDYILGCRKGHRIVTPNDAGTLAHEMRHVWDAYCK